jgi:uncharacterized membrane protein YciS (DUF1049 family)
MRMLRRILVAAIFVALIIAVRLFPDRNPAVIDIDLIVTQVGGVELWLALLTTFGAGVGCAMVVFGILRLRSGLLGRRYRKAIVGLEAEVHHLRNLPLAGGNLGEPDTEFAVVEGRANSRP